MFFLALQTQSKPQSGIQLFPEQASSYAWQVDALYFYLIAITIFFCALIIGVLIYFTVKYRRRSDTEIPQQIAGSHFLELTWTIVPFLISMTIFIFGASVYFTMYSPPTDALEVSVVGKQWMWKFQHPTGQREINELHVPIGRKVKVTITTEDVIHSFYVPDFRVKMDAVPGRYTTTWFEATKTGRFHLFCAEYCGTDHSKMGGWIEVMTPEDYERWLSGNLNNISPVQAGEQLFNSLGCVTCHAANGQGGRGPALAGLFGSQVRLQDGTTVTADESYIRESILNPGAKVVAGYPLIMPTYQGQVTEEQLLQLVTYVKSLAPARTDGISTTAPARSNNPVTGIRATGSDATQQSPTVPDPNAGRNMNGSTSNEASSVGGTGATTTNRSSSNGSTPAANNNASGGTSAPSRQQP